MNILNNFPRIIVDMSKWPQMRNDFSENSRNVVQLCILNDGKKTFLNIALDNSGGNIRAFITALDKYSSNTHEVKLRFNMDEDNDERDAYGCFELEL